MNILITGVNGFIGEHTVRSLEQSHCVFGLVRKAPDAPHPSLEYISADLTDSNLERYLPDGIDCVIHLAQSRRYREFPEGADDMRRTNIDATCRLLEWARKSRVKHFIFTSTANVYSKSTELLTESHPTQPESYYGASKLAAEHLIWQYGNFFQVNILRLFTVYGPGQQGMLIPNIIKRMKMGESITLGKGVGLYLTPIYVGNVVEVINKLIETPLAISSRLLNVCGDKVVHLGQIVMAIEDILLIEARVQLTDDEAKRFVGSNELIKRCLGDMDFTDIQTGLELTASNDRGGYKQYGDFF